MIFFQRLRLHSICLLWCNRYIDKSTGNKAMHNKIPPIRGRYIIQLIPIINNDDDNVNEKGKEVTPRAMILLIVGLSSTIIFMKNYLKKNKILDSGFYTASLSNNSNSPIISKILDKQLYPRNMRNHPNNLYIHVSNRF